jgi:hypothetical protein
LISQTDKLRALTADTTVQTVPPQEENGRIFPDGQNLLRAEEETSVTGENRGEDFTQIGIGKVNDEDGDDAGHQPFQGGSRFLAHGLFLHP